MPKKIKLELDDLTVKSFVTELSPDTQKDVKGKGFPWTGQVCTGHGGCSIDDTQCPTDGGICYVY